VSADLLEMRSEHAAREPALAPLPQAAGVPGVLEIGPDGPHHRMVESDQRLGDPERAAVFLEHIWLADDQAAVLQDVQRVREIARFAADVGGDAAPGAVALRDGGEHRVVQADVSQVGFVREQIARLAEQGTGRVQHGPRDPAVEVLRPRGRVVAYELPPVRGGAPGDGVYLEGQHGILDAPELGGEPVIQRRHDQFQARPAAQRRAAGQKPAHERQRGAAQQQPGAALLALRPPRPERVLEDRRQRRVGPGQVGELVDDHGCRTVPAECEQRVRDLTPVPELQRGGRSQVRTEIGSDPAQRFAVGRFLRREIEAGRRLAERAEQERLALAPAPGDHAKGGTWPRVRGEQGQLHPLEVPVEHVVGSPD
jgi:hypothetical protein